MKNNPPIKLFCGYGKNNFKVYIERQKIQNCQHNIEKRTKNKIGGLTLLDSKTLYKAIVFNSVVLAKEQKNRLIEQDKEFRNRPT